MPRKKSPTWLPHSQGSQLFHVQREERCDAQVTQSRKWLADGCAQQVMEEPKYGAIFQSPNLI